MAPRCRRRSRAAPTWSRRRAMRRTRRDGQFDRCRLRRGARQPAVSHHRAGERRRPDQSAGPAAVRQRRSGGDARLPAAGRQAAGAGLGSPGAEAVSNNARAIIALDRLVPLAAIAGIDDAKQLTIGEINRWYEVTREDDPARAPLRGYLLLELLRATGFDLPPRSTDLPDKPPGNARLVMPADGQPAGAGQRRRRRSPRRGGVARADRGRRDAAQRTSSCRHRDDRAGPAPGRRGLFGPPVRHGDGDRVRPLALKKKPSTPLSREAEAFIEMLSAERGASRNTTAAYGADLQEPRGLPGAAQAEAASTPMPRRCAPI